MKFIIIFTFMLSASHFTLGQTDKERQKIAKEIIAITDKYNRTWDNLDMNEVAKFHSNKSFKYYRHGNLSVGSNEEFKKMYPQYMATIKTLETIEFNNPVVQVLSKNTVVIGFKGAAKVVLKNGREELDSNTGTYVWQKINKEWKIVNIHESKK